MNRWLTSGLLAVLVAGCSLPWSPPDAPVRPETPTRMALQRPSATPAPAPSATPLPTAVVPDAPPSPTPTLTPTPTVVPVDADSRSRIFGELWQLVADRYVYEDYRGLDWAAIREEYGARVLEGDTAAFYGTLSELIRRFDDDHSHFQTPREVAEDLARFEGDQRYVGIGALVRETDEGVLLTRIARSSPAERAGLRPFDLVTHIDGIDVLDVEAIGPNGPIARVRGIEGTPVVLTIRRAAAAAFDVTVIRGVIPSDAFPVVELTALPQTGYSMLLLDTFNINDLESLIRDALAPLDAATPINGLIIDVRGNSGGRVDYLLDTVAMFVDGGSIGVTRSRATSVRDLIIPDDRTIAALRDVPIAILIGEGTASAGEMFAAGMRANRRAVLVGEPTSGNTENIVPHDFSDGSRLWLAEYVYLPPDGVSIEDAGVQPDCALTASYWEYPLEADPHVVLAIALLEQQRAGAALTCPQ